MKTFFKINEQKKKKKKEVNTGNVTKTDTDIFRIEKQ